MTKILPIISIIIPTYNEEQRIKVCLDSIFHQDYPNKLLDVYLVDNYSKDKTIEIAKNYPVAILRNKIKDTQISKMIGFNHSKGDLIYFVDADMEIKSTDYFRKLTFPLLHNPHIVGSFGNISQAPHDSSVNRFLTYDIHQRDPLLTQFSPSVMTTVIGKKNEYLLCKYTRNNIPPEGRCLFWKKKLMQTSLANGEEFRDLDSLVTLVKNGFCYFAYVPTAEAYHRHVQNVQSLITKRLRNIHRNFLPHYETREYTWFNLHNKKEIIKIVFWIIYAHLIVPAFFHGCIKAIRYKDWYCIWYEPFLTLLLTDISLYSFFSNPRGIHFIRSAFKN